MAAAVKAVSASLGKAAKTLEAGGDLAEFTKVVRALEKEKEITAEVARAAEKAAAARKGFAEASTELTKAMAGKAYTFPGPFADPDVYKALVKMAREAIKTKVADAQKFIEELKLARVRAKLSDLTPEELAKAKQAWEEAKALEEAQNVLYHVPWNESENAVAKYLGSSYKRERVFKNGKDIGERVFDEKTWTYRFRPEGKTNLRNMPGGSTAPICMMKRPK